MLILLKNGISRPCSEETKQKISIANKKRFAIFNPLKGRILSEETTQKLSEAHKGKKFTEEAKQNMSESHKRR